MNKQKVLIVVPSGTEREGWINPVLTRNLLAMQQDSRYEVQIEILVDYRPVEYARNFAMTLARDRKVDWLLMIDNDQGFEVSPLDILSQSCGLWVLGIPTFQRLMPGPNGPRMVHNARKVRPKLKRDGEFEEVDRVGTGCMFINHRVWDAIPKGPWFYRAAPKDDELLTPTITSDFMFCDLARENGFEIWVHQRMCLHFHNAELTRLGGYVVDLERRLGGRPQ